MPNNQSTKPLIQLKYTTIYIPKTEKRISLQQKAVAFTGPSNSGKTTLIEKISYKLSGSRKIAIIKHDPSDKALFDKEGKDSDKFFKSGADTAVISPTRTTLFLHTPHSVEDTAKLFGGFDLLMVEGLKHLPLPRIGVFRGDLDTIYLPYCKAIAIDDTVNLDGIDMPSDIDILNLNDIDEIIEWIDKNSTIMKG